MGRRVRSVVGAHRSHDVRGDDRAHERLCGLAQLLERIGRAMLARPSQSMSSCLLFEIARNQGPMIDDSGLGVSVAKPPSNPQRGAAMLSRRWSFPWLTRHHSARPHPRNRSTPRGLLLTHAPVGRITPAYSALKHVHVDIVCPSWSQIVDTSAFAGDLPSRPAVCSEVFPGQWLACFSATQGVPSQTQTYRRLAPQGLMKLVPGSKDFAAQLDRPLALGYGFGRKLAPAHGCYGTGERIESLLAADLGECYG